VKIPALMVIKYMIWSLDLLILEVSVYINCPPQEGRCIARRIIPCKMTGIKTALKDASNFNAPIPVSSEDFISL